MAGTQGIILGFLFLDQLTNGYQGGYLITDLHTRPMQFLYTSPFSLGGPQELLWGKDRLNQLLVDQIAKPLTDRQSFTPRAVFVSDPRLLELRTRIPAPVLLIELNGDKPLVVTDDDEEESAAATQDPFQTFADLQVFAHHDAPGDLKAFEKLRELTAAKVDWLEPFRRIQATLTSLREDQSSAA